MFERLGNTLKQSFLGTRQRLTRYLTAPLSVLSSTLDVGFADYKFWALARKGSAKGIEISGLLLRPLESKIAAWTLGKLPTVVMKKKGSSDFIAEWLQINQATIVRMYQQSVGMGDSFILVNPDLTTVVFPPDIVSPIVADDDYTNIIGWRIVQLVPHPSQPTWKMEIINDFTKTKRTKQVFITAGKPRARIFNKSYNNLIGKIPIIHVPNNAEAWERFGHAEGEPLLHLLQRYNEIFLAAIEGNKRQGRPTPVISGLGTPQEVDQFWKQYAHKIKHETEGGEFEEYEEIPFDADKLMTLGGQATFKWESPQPFASDTEKLLGLLFYLYIQHSELPEFILGNAVQTGADPAPQIEPLVKFIDKRRLQVEGWFTDLCEVALAYKGLSDPAARQNADDELELHWPKLTTQDANLSLTTVQWLYMQGMIDRKMAITLVPVDIANPDQALKDGEADFAKRPVQGYPTAGGSTPNQNGNNNPVDAKGNPVKNGSGGQPTDAQKKPGDTSNRAARSNGVGANGKPRNKRSDSRSPAPTANSQPRKKVPA